MNSPSNYNLIWQCHILLGTSFEWFYHGCSVSARCASGNCCKEASVWGPAHRTETSEMAAPKPQFLKHQPHGRTKSHPISLSNLAPVLSEQCCPEGFWCYSLDSAHRYPFYSVSCRLPIHQKNVGMFWVDFSLFRTLPTLTPRTAGVHHLHACPLLGVVLSVLCWYSLSRVSGVAQVSLVLCFKLIVIPRPLLWFL